MQDTQGMHPIVAGHIWVPGPGDMSEQSKKAFEGLQSKYPVHAAYRGWNPTPPDRDTYELVARYATFYVEDPVWEHMAKPGPQGVSLFYHEGEELRWLIDNGYQPFMRDPSRVPVGLRPSKRAWKRLVAAYPQAHAEGLVREHRYLQKRSGGKFSLGELVKWNPIAEDPEPDLRLLKRLVIAGALSSISLGDLHVNAANEHEVSVWYKRLRLNWYKRLWLLWLSWCRRLCLRHSYP